jgi:hypothetical protein
MAHQLVMTASIFKSALEKATAAKENLTPRQYTHDQRHEGTVQGDIYLQLPDVSTENYKEHQGSHYSSYLVYFGS